MPSGRSIDLDAVEVAVARVLVLAFRAGVLSTWEHWPTESRPNDDREVDQERQAADNRDYNAEAASIQPCLSAGLTVRRLLYRVFCRFHAGRTGPRRICSLGHHPFSGV